MEGHRLSRGYAIVIERSFHFDGNLEGPFHSLPSHVPLIERAWCQANTEHRGQTEKYWIYSHIRETDARERESGQGSMVEHRRTNERRGEGEAGESSAFLLTSRSSGKVLFVAINFGARARGPSGKRIHVKFIRSCHRQLGRRRSKGWEEASFMKFTLSSCCDESIGIYGFLMGHLPSRLRRSFEFHVAERDLYWNSYWSCERHRV